MTTNLDRGGGLSNSNLQPGAAGGGGGVLGLGPLPNTFGDASTANRAAAIALRNTQAADAAWLALYNDSLSNWIRLVWDTGAVEQRRNAAGNGWEDVTNVIRGQAGQAGRHGAQGVYDELIYRNAAAAPTNAPTGGSIASAGAVPTPPNNWTTAPTAPAAGQDTYAARARIDPASDTFPLTPTWSVPYEIGNPAGAQAAQAAAAAAQAAAESAETDAETAQAAAAVSATAAASNAANAATSAASATTAASSAADAQAAAETARTSAESAETDAETAQTAAEAAQTAAETARDEAQTAAAQAQADSDGTLLYGDGPPDDADGNNGDSYLDKTGNALYKKESGAWTLEYMIQASTPAPATHTSYTATGDDTAWTAAEFTSGNSGVGNALAVPIYTGAKHVAFARPVSAGVITAVYLYAESAPNKQNQIGAWTVQAATLDIGGEDHYVVYSNNALNPPSGYVLFLEVA